MIAEASLDRAAPLSRRVIASISLFLRNCRDGVSDRREHRRSADRTHPLVGLY